MVSRISIAKNIAWAAVCTAITVFNIVDLFGQVPEQRYADINNGFSAPAPGNADHSNPNIWRPPTRTAGVPVQESSAVATATWATPVLKPHSPLQSSSSIETQSAAQSGVPFKPPTANSASSGVRKPSSSWSSTLSMFVSLLLVLAIFFGVAWCFRRVAPLPNRGLSKDVVQVLGRTPLAPRHNMILIRFGRKLVLVSQQLGQTQTLSEIDDPLEVDHLLGLCEATSSTSISTSFRDVLFQLASGKGTDQPPSHVKKLSIAREG